MERKRGRPKTYKLPYPTRKELTLSSHSLSSKPEHTCDLFPWALWFKGSVLEAADSKLTLDAQLDDLQKFVDFFYSKTDGSVASWNGKITAAFLEALRKHGYAQTSIRRIFTTLKQFAHFLLTRHVLDHENDPMPRRKKAPPTQDVEPKTLRVVHNGRIIHEGKPVFQLLLEAARAGTEQVHDKRDLPYRNAAILAALYYSALRVSEICNLDYQQVTRRANGGYILSDVTCKNKRKRKEVFLTEHAEPYLTDYLVKERGVVMSRGKDSGPLFVTKTGKRLSRVAVWKILNRIARAAESRLPLDSKIVISPHILRHERAFSLLDAGLTETVVAQQLGHHDTRQIKRYTQRSNDYTFDVINKVD
jgi:integrase/recombinase XerD